MHTLNKDLICNNTINIIATRVENIFHMQLTSSSLSFMLKIEK